MLERLVTALVKARLRASPAVALVGARQSGKTTLARTLGGVYFDVEQPSERLRLDLEWEEVVERRELVILDEAQTWPELFPRLRAAIDSRRSRKGKFLLLGSVSPDLMIQVSESLAGRLALVELTPFLLGELTSTAARGRLWLTGGYPDGGILRPKSFPQWQLDYLRLLLERDLPSWGLPARPQTAERLVRMLAAVHGQLWNASQVGKSLGLSYHTVNTYLDYLVGAFLIRRLPPFHANLKKRLVKSPKVYWRDSGLLHALLNVRDKQALLLQPWVGVSWEGFVIEQVLDVLSALGVRHEAYHFRTSDQSEIDLVLETEGGRWAVEVKLTTAPSREDMARMDRVATLVGASDRYLISQTANPAGNDRRGSGNLAWFIARLRERFEK
jgi:predicted AAA+ superfamily ATPase